MSEPEGTLARALSEATALLASLGDELADEATALALLEALGVAMPEAPPSLLAVRDAVAEVVSVSAELGEAIGAAGEGSAEAVAKLVELSVRSGEAFVTLSGLPPQMEADLAAYPDLLAEVDLLALVDALVTRLVAGHMRRRAPLVYNALALVGVVDPEVRDGEGVYGRQHVRDQLRWDRLRMVATDPGGLLAAVYGWGTDRFDDDELLRRLHYLLMSAGLPLQLLVAGEGSPLSTELRLALFAETGEQGSIEAGLALGMLPPPPASPPSAAGLGLRPYALGSAAAEIELRPGLRIGLEGGFQAAGGLVLGLRPPFDPELLVTGGASADLGLMVDWARADGLPIALVRQPDWFAIELGGLAARLGATVATDGTVALSAGVTTVGGRLRLAADEGDGFLRQILPPEGITADFDLGLAWSPATGLRFTGSAGFEVTLPLHLSLLGVLDVEAVHVALRAAAGSGLTGAATTTFAVHLGPVKATVERMGFGLALTAPPERGNLGPFQLDTRFRPPTGAGLVVEAGPVVGGGYVFLDYDAQQYAGVLQLEFKGIALKAVGIITTRLPDGSDGFSMLLIISAEFTPIQLGFGFTLNGVGGLIGINRTVELEVLRAGVKTRALDSIMFPRDPVANAPQLISNLSAVFPPVRGRFVVGPMARLGWGSPTLLTLDIGLILELPAPVRLVILGRLRMALPREDAAIVVINMDVLGIVDFERGEASVDATLYDSQIAGFALTGDMAMRAGWGERPGLALAAGGFHPRFQPPPAFPVLERLALTLCTGDNPRLRLEAYLALTSNTAQFGARLELYAAALGFSIEGMLAFDALFQFSPFALLVDIAGSIALKQGSRTLMGVSVSLTLEGPAPWHAYGRARFEILFFTAEISFDARFGEPVPRPLPAPVIVEDLVAAALGDVRNWSAQLPPEGESLVTLRQIPAADGQLLVHPLGTIAVAQRVAPLGRSLERFGTAPISGPTRMDITRLRVGLGDPATDPIDEHFAPAQFLDLTDDQELARPSFERWEAGRRVRRGGFTRDSSPPIEAVLDPETTIIDKPDRPAAPARPAASFPLAPDGAVRIAAAGAAARAPVRRSGARRFAAPALDLAVRG